MRTIDGGDGQGAGALDAETLVAHHRRLVESGELLPGIAWITARQKAALEKQAGERLDYLRAGEQRELLEVKLRPSLAGISDETIITDRHRLMDWSAEA